MNLQFVTGVCAMPTYLMSYLYKHEDAMGTYEIGTKRSLGK